MNPPPEPRAGALEAVWPPEHLDREDLSLADTRRALRDLHRLHRFSCGFRAPAAAVTAILTGRSRSRLLDVAAGSGEVGAAVRRAALRRRIDLQVVALDRKLSHLLVGRRSGAVRLAVVGVAEQLPFADEAFDCSLSSLFFHHLAASGKRKVAEEMRRVATRGAVIVDLRRAWWAPWAVRLLFTLLGVGRVAREDGLTSLERSWTVAEWRERFDAEGSWQIEPRFPARVSVTAAEG